MTDRHLSDIRAQPYPACCVCGATGKALYDGLRDRHFKAPGIWNLSRCINPNCGVIWLDPMPVPEDIGLAYQTYFTHQALEVGVHAGAKLAARTKNFIKRGYLARKYGYLTGTTTALQSLAGLCAHLNPVRLADLDFLAMHLQRRSQGRLLDVGCGSGGVLRNMRELGWEVEGLDPDHLAVQAARALGLPVQEGSLADCKYPSGRFDAITMVHVIEHLHDPLFHLRKAHRLLKKGGSLVMLTPNAASLGHRLFKRDWVHLDPPRHLHVFTCRSLAVLAERAGFRVEKLFPTVRWAPHAIAHSIRIHRLGTSNLDVAPRQMIYALSWIVAFAEWAMLRPWPSLGEEIVLVARKQTEGDTWLQDVPVNSD